MGLQTSFSLNALWSGLIVEELLRNRIDQFVLSPGSRCTPLTAAAAAEKKVRCVMHFDERGAAYFAVGHARATGKPAVLVCTSGTAVANYYPAVVEAFHERLPLIVLTADRPPELRDSGANQTIDQIRLFGKHARFHFDLPCPDREIPPEFVLTLVDQAVHRATRSPMGPVHLNCMFREPLAPSGGRKDYSAYLTNVERWVHGSAPHTVYAPSVPAVDSVTIEQAAALINRTRDGLLVAGDLKFGPERAAALGLARKLNWPVFADIRSGLRLGIEDAGVVHYFDQLLLSARFPADRPSTILHLGGSLVSKRFLTFLTQSPPAHYMHVADHPLRQDPEHRVSLRIESDIDGFCRRLTPLVKSLGNNRLLKPLKAADRAAGRVIENFIGGAAGITEPAVARSVSKHIAPGSFLFLGNSMPVRDMDMYADSSGPQADVAANRGVSGIDGTIAAAAGYANGARTSGTLVVGDLAFLHDLNSLALLSRISDPLIVVVVNNDGGGIFSFLPVAECREIFEPFFATPHGLTFGRAARTFGLDYYRSRSSSSFVEDYRTAQKAGRPAVIEVGTDRRKNLAFHQSLQKEIRMAVESL